MEGSYILIQPSTAVLKAEGVGAWMAVVGREFYNLMADGKNECSRTSVLE